MNFAATTSWQSQVAKFLPLFFLKERSLARQEGLEPPTLSSEG